jgi:hypothetical protein
MSETEKQKVREAIANEGMWYCFAGYSNYPEIKDPEFHRRCQAADIAKEMAALMAIEKALDFGLNGKPERKKPGPKASGTGTGSSSLEPKRKRSNACQ